ncbi:IS3 family transposase [Lentimicrobium sp. S6]|uniref:IS3 family transposase n=1 Tax=Lentimicrobium sp. S6 TaxID=2735872 RepID=UPI00352E2333
MKENSKMAKKSSTGLIKDIKRQTRRVYSAEEKIRVVIEGMQREESVAAICRKYGINDSVYYKWSKDFLEAGKKQLSGDTTRNATNDEVDHLKKENDDLKKALADLYLHNQLLKKSNWLGVNPKYRKYMRISQLEKFEIIQLVEQSTISINKTLAELGIHKSTFYKWYNAYLKDGYDGLAKKPRARKQYWNQIPEGERLLIIELALEHPEKSPREIACLYTDTYKRFISESSSYRILKAKGLIRPPAFDLIRASNEFKDKTVRVNEMWQTDFTYFKILGWGWYYLSTVLDDYSRFIVHWKLCKNMTAKDAESTINEALCLTEFKNNQKPKLLSDNGSSYIAADFRDYLQDNDIKQIHGRPGHPQTQGKIERYHRSMKNVIKLDIYHSPMELEHALKKFVHYYNYKRYHESLNNVTPSDMYFGKAHRILEKRKKIKQLTLSERRSKYYASRQVS